MADHQDALLGQLGERMNLGLGEQSVRNNLLNFLGEEKAKRVIDVMDVSEVTEKVELEPIDQEEIDIAKLQIMEMHPLDDTPMGEAFPWLCVCMRLCGSEKKPKDSVKMRNKIDKISKRLDEDINKAGGKKYKGTSARRDMCKKFGVAFVKKDGTEQVAKEKKQSDEDKASPFAEYGFGIKAWIGTLYFLFCWYLVFSVLAFLMMKLYAGFDGLGEGTGKMGWTTKYSLGNIGFAKSFCLFQYATMTSALELKCAKGTLSDLKFAGAVSATQGLKQKDGTTLVGHDFCGDPTLLSADADCSAWLNLPQLQQDYKTGAAGKCAGEKSCTIDLSTYMKKDATSTRSNDHFTTGIPAGAPDACYSKFTQLYMQVGCDPSEAELVHAKQTACMIIFIGLLICLTFNLAIDYLAKVQTFAYKKWDVDTCTPADYTIKFHISEAQYKNYLDSRANGEYCMPLDEMITKTLETQVGQVDGVLDADGVDDQTGKKVPIKVATITFGYKNGDLIRELKARGALIGQGAFEKVPEKDALLNQILKDDADQLKQPVCAFVTFTEQEAYERCENYFFKYNLTDGSYNHSYKPWNFLEEEGQMEAAPEPSNVIWENLEVTPYRRAARKSGAVMVMVTFLFLTFLVYSALKSSAGENKLKYPARTDCAALDGPFTAAGVVDKETFAAYAAFDREATAAGRGAGFYLCYCKEYTKRTETFKAEKPEDELCYQYWADNTKAMALSNFVSILVTAMNIVIRTINIKLVNAIGYATESKQVSLIMLSVFYATFVNTGIIMLMTNAELSHTVLAFLPLRNQYPDLDGNWYEEVGPALTKTMCIMAFYPYIEMFIFGGKKKFSQLSDKGFGCGSLKTKTTTSMKYIDMYAGPIYLMHFKYSSIMTQVFISFMYGLFLPVLFPIAALGIMNMYLVEKWALLYYFRKPPMYDDKLQKEALRVLSNAPFMMLFMGYWAMGSTGLFFGTYSFRTHNNSVADPQHPLIDHGHGFNQTHWLLILCFLGVGKRFVIDTIGKCIKAICQNCCQVEWEQDIRGADVQEPIGNYWESMTGDDQKVWYATEVYASAIYGISSVNEHALEMLRTKDRRKAPKINIDGVEKKANIMEGDSRYDILANVVYQQAFQYIPLDQRNEPEDFHLSDMIMRSLNQDDDKTGGKGAKLFHNSYKLLANQAMSTSAAKKEEHKSNQVNDVQEGGESDAYHRFNN